MSYVAHFPETLFLELSITDRQHLIHNQNFRFQVCSYGKSQAHIHPAGIAFDRSINEFLHSGKINYLIKLRANLGLGHPQNRAVEKNVFASRQFRVETGPHLQQTGDTSLHPHFPACRRCHTGEDLQQRALARTVPANDPENFPLLHFKRHTPQRPDFVVAQ